MAIKPASNFTFLHKGHMFGLEVTVFVGQKRLLKVDFTQLQSKKLQRL